MKYKKYIKNNLMNVLTVVFLQMMMWGLQVLVQFFAINAFDGAIKLNLNMFLKWTIISFFVWLIYFLVCAIEGYLRAKAIKHLNNDVRHDMYLTMFNKCISEIESSDKSTYISYVTNNINEITRFFWEPMFNFAGRIFQITWSIVALLYIDKYLFLFSIASTFVMILIPKIFENKMEKIGEDNLKAQANAMGKFKDLLYGMIIIKLLNAKEWYIERGFIASEISEDAKFKQSYKIEFLECIMGILSVSIQILSEVIVVMLAFLGRVNVAVIAGAANLIGGVSNGLNQLLNARINMSQSKPYINILENNIDKSAKELKFEDNLFLENISYSYGEKEVFNNLNLKFFKNKKYAIIGKSGAGKSTLLKIIIGMICDYGGDVLYDGKVRNKNIIDLNISYMTQNVYLFNDTIRENILLGNDFSDSEIDKAISKSELKEFIDKLPKGMDTIVGEEGGRISGGEKQRIGIARYLLHSKDLILIDEGFNALDKKTRNIIENNILNDEHLTVIMVTHHMDEDLKNKFDEIYDLNKLD